MEALDPVAAATAHLWGGGTGDGPWSPQADAECRIKQAAADALLQAPGHSMGAIALASLVASSTGTRAQLGVRVGFLTLLRQEDDVFKVEPPLPDVPDHLVTLRVGNLLRKTNQVMQRLMAAQQQQAAAASPPPALGRRAPAAPQQQQQPAHVAPAMGGAPPLPAPPPPGLPVVVQQAGIAEEAVQQRMLGVRKDAICRVFPLSSDTADVTVLHAAAQELVKCPRHSAPVNSVVTRVQSVLQANIRELCGKRFADLVREHPAYFELRPNPANGSDPIVVLKMVAVIRQAGMVVAGGGQQQQQQAPPQPPRQQPPPQPPRQQPPPQPPPQPQPLQQQASAGSTAAPHSSASSDVLLALVTARTWHASNPQLDVVRRAVAVQLVQQGIKAAGSSGRVSTHPDAYTMSGPKAGHLMLSALRAKFGPSVERGYKSMPAAFAGDDYLHTSAVQNGATGSNVAVHLDVTRLLADVTAGAPAAAARSSEPGSRAASAAAGGAAAAAAAAGKGTGARPASAPSASGAAGGATRSAAAVPAAAGVSATTAAAADPPRPATSTARTTNRQQPMPPPLPQQPMPPPPPPQQQQPPPPPPPDAPAADEDSDDDCISFDSSSEEEGDMLRRLLGPPSAAAVPAGGSGGGGDDADSQQMSHAHAALAALEAAALLLMPPEAQGAGGSSNGDQHGDDDPWAAAAAAGKDEAEAAAAAAAAVFGAASARTSRAQLHSPHQRLQPHRTSSSTGGGSGAAARGGAPAAEPWSALVDGGIASPDTSIRASSSAGVHRLSTLAPRQLDMRPLGVMHAPAAAGDDGGIAHVPPAAVAGAKVQHHKQLAFQLMAEGRQQLQQPSRLSAPGSQQQQQPQQRPTTGAVAAMRDTAAGLLALSRTPPDVWTSAHAAFISPGCAFGPNRQAKRMQGMLDNLDAAALAAVSFRCADAAQQQQRQQAAAAADGAGSSKVLVRRVWQLAELQVLVLVPGEAGNLKGAIYVVQLPQHNTAAAMEVLRQLQRFLEADTFKIVSSSKVAGRVLQQQFGIRLGPNSADIQTLTGMVKVKEAQDSIRAAAAVAAGTAVAATTPTTPTSSSNGGSADAVAGGGVTQAGSHARALMSKAHSMAVKLMPPAPAPAAPPPASPPAVAAADAAVEGAQRPPSSSSPQAAAAAGAEGAQPAAPPPAVSPSAEAPPDQPDTIVVAAEPARADAQPAAAQSVEPEAPTAVGQQQLQQQQATLAVELKQQGRQQVPEQPAEQAGSAVRDGDSTPPAPSEPAAVAVAAAAAAESVAAAPLPPGVGSDGDEAAAAAAAAAAEAAAAEAAAGAVAAAQAKAAKAEAKAEAEAAEAAASFSAAGFGKLLALLPSRLQQDVEPHLKKAARSSSSATAAGAQLLTAVVADAGQPVMLRFSDRSSRQLGFCLMQEAASLLSQKQQQQQGGDNGAGQEAAAATAMAALFAADGCWGVPGTLHVVCALLGRGGCGVRGLTYRINHHVPARPTLLGGVRRSVSGSVKAALLQAQQAQQQDQAAHRPYSLLVCGRPATAAAKAGFLRDLARLLSLPAEQDGEGLSVLLVDTYGRIGGLSEEPSPLVGRARQLAVPDRAAQGQLLLQGALNHQPDVVIVDELLTEKDMTVAQVLLAQRCVCLIAGSPLDSLEQLLQHPASQPLLGGLRLAPPKLSGDGAPAQQRPRRSSASASASSTQPQQPSASSSGGRAAPVLERVAPPLFSSLVEMLPGRRWTVHADLAASIDGALSAAPAAVGGAASCKQQ